MIKRPSRQNATLMVLGAGYLQAPLIRMAVQLGLQVVTVDNVPGNIGHRESHASVNVSTTDKEKVLLAAQAFGIDGIMTACSDIAVATAAYVANRLGLSGIPSAQAEMFCYKDCFRDFQRRHGLRHPRFVAVSAAEVLACELGALSEEVVVKPVDRSGSRGVTRVQRGDRANLAQAISYARQHGLSGRICIEDVLSGMEYGGDAFVVDGSIAHSAVTNKHLVQTIVRGHSLPCQLSKESLRKVTCELQEHITALGYLDGPINFDVMVDATEQPCVIEMSPRIGGNWIPALIHRSTGIDYMRGAIHAALGAEIDLGSPGEEVAPCASYVLAAPKSGVVERVPDNGNLLVNQHVIQCELNVTPGDKVYAMRDSGDQIGRVLFELPNGSNYWEIATDIEAIVWEQMKVL